MGSNCQSLPHLPLTPAGRVEREIAWLKGVQDEAASLDAGDLIGMAEIHEDLAARYAVCAVEEVPAYKQPLIHLAGLHTTRAGIYKAAAVAKQTA